MAKGIYERKGKHGDVCFYIRYQFQGTDIKERVGRRSREALKARLGEMAQGRFSLEKTRKPVPFSKLVEHYREYGASTKRAWEEEKHILEMFADLFGETPLSQVTPDRLRSGRPTGEKRLSREQ